ncbi:GreA/GreB family elongation factor [Francisella tularensis]|nr:GreA/GreB family elongation factor [Francisella tularensis]
MASALIGKRLNDIVIIETPGGSMEVKITKIEAAQ